MTKTPDKSDRIKLALIPVLGIALFFVLPGGDDESSGEVPELVSSFTSSEGENTKQQAKSAQISWPRISLKTTIAHNPFILSDPRAELDRRFLEAGITAPEEMTEISPDEFLSDDDSSVATNENDSSVATYDEDALLAELVAEFVDHEEQTTASASGQQTPATGPRQAIRIPEVRSEVSEPDELEAELYRRRVRLAALKNESLTMFMSSHRGNSALLGDRPISEGEIIEEGIRVTHIGRDGVQFEVIDPAIEAKRQRADSSEQP